MEQVKGHWRKQWYPLLGMYVWVYIAPYTRSAPPKDER